MKKLGKILGFGLLGVFALILALGFAITHLLDPNDHKEDFQRLARDEANIALTLNDRIGWSFFPRLGLTLRDVSIASATTPDQPFAHAKTLALSARLLPLLQKRLQLDSAYLDGLNLTLVRHADGHGNWEGIGPSPPPERPKAEASKGSDASSIAFDIDRISISHGQASYADLRQDKRFSLTELSLTTGAIGNGKTTPLSFSGRFDNDGLSVGASLDAALHFDFDAQHYRFENFKLSGEISGGPFAGKSLPFSVEGPLSADFALDTAETSSLKLAVGEARGEASLKMNHLDQTPQLEGVLTVALFNPRRFFEAAGNNWPSTADDTALTQAALRTKISGDTDNVQLTDLRVTIDETTLAGSFSIEHFRQPRWRLTLKGDRFNADRYLPPPAKIPTAGAAKQTPPASASQQPLWDSEPVLPLAVLRSLALDAAVTLDTLTFHKQLIKGVTAKVNAKEGVLTLDVLQGALLDGHLTAQGRLDARQDMPKIALQTKINGIAIDKLLEAKSDTPSPLRGKLNLDSRLATTGNSRKAWVDDLNGNADFVITDGVLRDFNVEQQTCRVIALINRKALTSEYGGKDTAFREFKGSLKLTDGVADNRDFKASTPGVSVSGRGQFDLRTLGIDYRLGVVIEGDRHAMPDPACQINKNYANIAWPIRCRGDLTQTSTGKLCGVDSERLPEIAAQLAGSKLLDKLDKKLDDSSDGKAPASLKNALKGLFKR